MNVSQSSYLIKRDGKVIAKTCLPETVQHYANNGDVKVIKIPVNR